MMVSPDFDDDLTDAERHQIALRDTGYWGARGAGVLPVCPATGRIMLARRSLEVEQPHTWGTFGGAIDAGETEVEAALRECREEIGVDLPAAALAPLHRFVDGNFAFQNFLAPLDAEVQPERFGWEIEDAGWFPLDGLPDPKHFGLLSILDDKVAVELLESLIGRHYSPKP